MMQAGLLKIYQYQTGLKKVRYYFYGERLNNEEKFPPTGLNGKIRFLCRFC
jgi:hypothetical protein